MNELAAQSTAPDEWPAIRSIAAARLQETGVAGAGGAGFPTYAKWERLDDVEYLLMNHQESEPNYRIDRWLAATHPQVFADLFEVVLSQVLDVVVIAAKQKDRSHLRPLENATDGRVVLPEDLPIDASSESGVVFAYTDDTYQYGMESVLLNTVANTVLSEGVPMDHGWLVQNTETLFNIQAAFREERPVTRKYVHVDGANVTHRFLDVPIGTPASDVLAAAGLADGIPEECVLAHGGPGWCFECEEPAAELPIRKHTNCLLVLDAATAAANSLGNGRIDVLDTREWDRPGVESEPTSRLNPDRVRIPYLTNADFTDLVAPSMPMVSVGDQVDVGDRVATPATDTLSVAQHASVTGTVSAVTDRYVEIQATDATAR